MAEFKRKCIYCWKEFFSSANCAKYCGKVCQNAYNHRRRKAERNATKGKRQRTHEALTDIDRLAKEAGMSYGMYVALHSL